MDSFDIDDYLDRIKDNTETDLLVYRDILEVKGPNKCYQAIQKDYPTFPHRIIQDIIRMLRDDLDCMDITINLPR